jgi:hypothetical protein
MKALLSTVDHLVYATSDLQDAIRRLEALLGVTAAIGGQHAKWRTQNALISLGPRTYLEIMGPDNSAPDPLRLRPFGIEGLKTPRLVTWVAHYDDLQEIITVAGKEGLDLGEIQPGSRIRPDGSTLRWKMTDLTKDRKAGAIPYFIDWGDTSHPAASAPSGCKLRELKVFHPEAETIRYLLSKLGLDQNVERGPVSFEATILSPKGEIVLT